MDCYIYPLFFHLSLMSTTTHFCSKPPDQISSLFQCYIFSEMVELKQTAFLYKSKKTMMEHVPLFDKASLVFMAATDSSNHFHSAYSSTVLQDTT